MAPCWSARSIRSAAATRSRLMPEPGSTPSRWNGCRASPAPSQWTSCPRSRTSPATRRCSKPIFVENVAGIEGEGAGGYATEMSPEYQKAQAELVSGHIAKQDIVVTTALIPGKPAPRLISDAQIATMRPGGVIVDLAADAG